MAALTDIKNLRIIPDWLQRSLQPKDLEAIRASVIKAEAKTTAEIVPMIVRRSIVIGHVPLILFLFFSVLALMVAPSVTACLTDRWPDLSLVTVDFAGLMTAAILATVFTQVVFVQRLLTSVADTYHQVHARAHLEFETSNVRKTSLHTGILLFVSLAERKVVILADEAISARLPDETWIQIIEPLLQKIKSGQLAEGLSEAILHCGKLTESLFPAKAEHQNELGNDLIIKD